MNHYAWLPTVAWLISSIGCLNPSPALRPDEEGEGCETEGHRDASVADMGMVVTHDDASVSADAGSPSSPSDAAIADAGVAGGGGDPRDGGDPVWMTQRAVEPGLMSTDGELIYWTSPSSVHACALGDRCSAPITLGANEPLPTALAADGTNVYWTTTDDAQRGRGSIRYRARNASGDGPITVTNNEQAPRCISGGNGFVFWCTSGAEQNRNIHRARLDGTQEIAVASGSNAVETMVLERGSSQLVWANTMGILSNITVQFAPNTQRTDQDLALAATPIFSIEYEGFVYFIESGGAGTGRIVRQRFSPTLGALEVVFSGDGSVIPKSLALSSNNLFFTSSTSGATPSQVYQLDLSTIPANNNSLTQRLRATPAGDFNGIVAVNGYLFIADPANNRILRIFE